MFDVVGLGELLIDFTPSGNSENGNVLFEQNPGGAPANVIAAIAKLGTKSAFIGKVGDDAFGHFLTQTLANHHIDISGMVYSNQENTTLAFVQLDEHGDRSFSFYRNPGADMMLRPEEIKLSLLQNCKIFHFGSISLTHEPARSSTFFAVKLARKSGALISYDPNLRLPLWKDETIAKELILKAMPMADIVKISEEELLFLTGCTDLEQGSALLTEQYPIQLLLITLGEQGCFYRKGSMMGYVKGFEVKTIDTTGAGDAFLGGLLNKILESGIKVEDLNKHDLERCIRFANAVGALVTTKKGAIPAMPGIQEIEKMLQE